MFTDDEIAQINKVQQLIRRKAKSNCRAFTDPSVVKDYLMNVYAVRDSEREVFRIIYLDTQNRMIADEPLFYGTVDASPVYPRVVVQKCLQHNAAAVIFSHNHPSGVAEPSQADRDITKRLKSALDLVDIRVLDHIVCGDTSTVSFVERGFL